MSNTLINLTGALGTVLAETSGAAASNAVFNPFSSALGATLAGTSGTFSGAVWVASELAKFGKRVGGRPGEISAAVMGVFPGAMAGLFVGSLLGVLSGNNMVNFYLGNNAPVSSQANAAASNQAVLTLTDLKDLPALAASRARLRNPGEEPIDSKWTASNKQ